MSNLFFTISKKEIDNIVNCFKPAIKEDRLKFFVDNGNVSIEMDDLGNILRYDFGQEVEPSDIKEFYISLDVLKNLSSTLSEDIEAKFNVDNEGGMKIEVGTTVLNMSLTSEVIEINDAFEPAEEEVLLSDKVNMLCQRLKVVKASGQIASPVMVMGKNIKMGSQLSYTIIHEDYGLEKLEFNAISEFFNYFNNIYKFGDEVKLEINKDKSLCRLSCENVTYIVRCLDDSVTPPDLSPLLDGLKTKTTVNKGYLDNELAILSIPVSGQNQNIRIVNIEIDKNELVLRVKDLGNRISESRIKIANGEGDAEVKVRLDGLKSCIAPLQDDFEIMWSQNVVALDDEIGTTLLVGVMNN